MSPEVREAFTEWVTGAVIGAIPLFAHLIAFYTMTPAQENHVVGGWAVDVLFISITISSTSLVSVANRLRKSGRVVVQGRSSPAQVALTALFLVAASIHYAGVVTGHSRGDGVAFSIGLALGAAFVSLYLEMTLAARVAAAKPKRRSAAIRAPKVADI